MEQTESNRYQDAKGFPNTGTFISGSAPGTSPEYFLDALLAEQSLKTKADSAAILRSGLSGHLELIAKYPKQEKMDIGFDWLSRIRKPFQKAVTSGKTVALTYERPSKGDGIYAYALVIVPIGKPENIHAAAAFRVPVHTRNQLLLAQTKLESTALLLDNHQLALKIQNQSETENRLRCVLEILDAINRPSRFLGVAMALCNEIAQGFNCSRVCLGFLDRHCIRMKAMSHCDTFAREMQTVKAIEAIMEECLDQDLEVRYPSLEADQAVNRAVAKYSDRHGASSVLSLPIRRNGKVPAVLTLIRSSKHPFDNLKQIETLRLLCELVSPRLLDLHRDDRWLGAQIAHRSRRLIGRFCDTEHVGLKLSAAIVCIALLLLATLKVEYEIGASFSLKAESQQSVVAPFDTFLKEVAVLPGDRAQGGATVLGTLETAELRLHRAALMAEKRGYRKQMAASMRDRKTVDAHIADLQSQKMAARIRLLDKQIEQARLVAPIDGWVISRDRKQQIGAPVKAGDVLFEIASIDALRAELKVPETSIPDVTVNQAGLLAAVGHPDQKIPFVVERIHPVAEVMDQQNIFRVRGRIDTQRDWMRPGMEGEARISAGEKTLLWVVSHRIIDWLRVKLWI